MTPTLAHYLVVAALLFALGLYMAITRKNAVGVLLGVALVLNSAALDFVAFDHFVAEPRGPSGQVFVLFIIVLAAFGTLVALALSLQAARSHRSLAVDELTRLKH